MVRSLLKQNIFVEFILFSEFVLLNNHENLRSDTPQKCNESNENSCATPGNGIDRLTSTVSTPEEDMQPSVPSAECNPELIVNIADTIIPAENIPKKRKRTIKPKLEQEDSKEIIKVSKKSKKKSLPMEDTAAIVTTQLSEVTPTIEEPIVNNRWDSESKKKFDCCKERQVALLNGFQVLEKYV